MKARSSGRGSSLGASMNVTSFPSSANIKPHHRGSSWAYLTILASAQTTYHLSQNCLIGSGLIWLLQLSKPVAT
jgi:hypothetical protein